MGASTACYGSILLDKLDERELVERAAEDDHRAFQVLVERYQRKAYTVAFGILRNEDEAKSMWKAEAGELPGQPRIDSQSKHVVRLQASGVLGQTKRRIMILTSKRRIVVLKEELSRSQRRPQQQMQSRTREADAEADADADTRGAAGERLAWMRAGE